MALPLVSQLAPRDKKRDKVIAIELGAKSTKALHLQRRGEIFGLINYALFEAPELEGKKPEIAEELLREHLRKVFQTLAVKAEPVVIVLGAGDGRLAHADFPPKTARRDVRSIVRRSPKTYFQEDLPGGMFDAELLPSLPAPVHTAAPASSSKDASLADKAPDRTEGEAVDKGSLGEKGAGSGGAGVPLSPAPAGSGRLRAVVGGAREELVRRVVRIVEELGFETVCVTLAQIGPFNAFRLMPAVFQKEAVALVDLGFHNSSISILLNDQLVLNRVVPIGGDKLTKGLAESLNINYSVAEGIKLVMPEKVQAKLQALIAPLAEELRASAAYFEREFERSISQVYVAGAAARSDLLVHMIEAEAIIPCKRWNPTTFLSLDLSPEKAEELAKESPLLAPVVGAALSWFREELVQVNFLAEEQEAEELRRRDPVRRGLWVAGALVALMLCYVGWMQVRVFRLGSQMAALRREVRSTESASQASVAVYKQVTEVERIIRGLRRLASARFLSASTLDAMQYVVVDGIQFVRLQLDRDASYAPATLTTTNAVTGRIMLGKPAAQVDRITLALTAKDYGTPPAADEFMDTLVRHPYFREQLRIVDPVRLRDRQPRQVDALDNERSFILFTLECAYGDRGVRDE